MILLLLAGWPGCCSISWAHIRIREHRQQSGKESRSHHKTPESSAGCLKSRTGCNPIIAM